MSSSEKQKKYHFHGRRYGRPLNASRKDALETLLPELEFTPDRPLAEQFAPLKPQQLWLEIGFGNGEHLAAQAAAHPEIAMIGCEPFINGVAALMKQIRDQGIENIRVWPDDARVVLDNLPEQSLDRVFILFSDPWPKKKHHRRRVIQTDTLDKLARLMKDGAELRIATDFPDLAAWSLSHVLRHAGFDWQAHKADDWRIRSADWPPTRYEEKAVGHGAKPVYLRFVRRNRGAQAQTPWL